MKPTRTWKAIAATASGGALAAAALTGGTAIADDSPDRISLAAVSDSTAAEQELRRELTGQQVAADARDKAPGTPALPARLNAAADDGTDSPATADSPVTADSPATTATADTPPSAPTADTPPSATTPASATADTPPSPESPASPVTP